MNGQKILAMLLACILGMVAASAAAEIVTVTENVDMLMAPVYLTRKAVEELVVFLDESICVVEDAELPGVLWLINEEPTPAEYSKFASQNRAQVTVAEMGYSVRDVFAALDAAKPYVIRRWYRPSQVEKFMQELLGTEVSIECQPDSVWALVSVGEETHYILYDVEELSADEVVSDDSVNLLLHYVLAEESEYAEPEEEPEAEEARLTLSYDEILTFFDLIRPDEANVVKIKERDGWKVTFYSEDSFAMLIGENGQYSWDTVVTSIENSPRVFNATWYQVEEIPAFIARGWGLTEVSAVVSGDVCVLTIGQFTSELPVQRADGEDEVCEIDLYRAIFTCLEELEKSAAGKP